MKLFNIIKMFGRVLLEGVKTYLGLAWQGLQTLLRMSENEIEDEYEREERSYSRRLRTSSYDNDYDEDYDNEDNRNYHKHSSKKPLMSITDVTDAKEAALNTLFSNEYKSDFYKSLMKHGINPKKRFAIKQHMEVSSFKTNDYSSEGFIYLFTVTIAGWEVRMRFYKYIDEYRDNDYHEIDERHIVYGDYDNEYVIT